MEVKKMPRRKPVCHREQRLPGVAQPQMFDPAASGTHGGSGRRAGRASSRAMSGIMPC